MCAAPSLSVRTGEEAELPSRRTGTGRRRRAVVVSSLRWAALLGALTLQAGCAPVMLMASPRASVQSMPATGFVPTAEAGLVFGRCELVLDGVKIAPGGDPQARLRSISMHVSEFTGVDALETNGFVPGQWSIKADMVGDGYFAASLKPGRYYIVEQQFLSLPDLGFTGFRSYDEASGKRQTDRRTVTTFEVKPGQVSYVGTLRHQIDVEKTGLWVKSWRWRQQVVDDSAAADGWLKEHFPAAAPRKAVSLGQVIGL